MISTARASQDNYLINKGDVLEINVWKEEELTRALKVRIDGKISLPLLDDVQAAGRTPVELKETVEQGLSEFMEGPEVTVIVQKQNGQFYLIGEVIQAGAYPLQKDLTIVQALALAGGFTEWADKNKILLLRRSKGNIKRLTINYNQIVSGKSPEHNALIQPNDTIIVR
jgi:polysaccharide export outer membrane protein